MSLWMGSESSCTACLTNVHSLSYHQYIVAMYLILNLKLVNKFGNLNIIINFHTITSCNSIDQPLLCLN